MKLPHDWIDWMVEIGCNQTNNDFDNGRTRFSSSSSFSEWEKCGFLRKWNSQDFQDFQNPLNLFHPILSAFLEWLFREHEHLKRENENEMEKYLLIANQQWIKMNLFHNECCFQWDLECLVKSSQVKSNQIKSNHTFQYHISHITVNTIPLNSLN